MKWIIREKIKVDRVASPSGVHGDDEQVVLQDGFNVYGALY